MWSLHDEEKDLKPLVFSNGKSQEDIVVEVIKAINEGYKVVFIKGQCGTGKSAIALNIARNIGKTSIVVPIKSLQEQYSSDYSGKKFVLKNKFNLKNSPLIKNNPLLTKSSVISNPEKLKISSIVGRQNFKCRYLEEFGLNAPLRSIEKNATLSDIFEGIKRPKISKEDSSCDNIFLPCKIEIKEKNLDLIKDFIKQNEHIKMNDFDSISEVKRMSIAPSCPYWSPILPKELDIKKFKEERKLEYKGLNGKTFIFHHRKPGCPFYDQYTAYADSDVIIFNSAKYLVETMMDRKPETELEIIDECDDFLDSLANQENINLERLGHALNTLFLGDPEKQKIIAELRDITEAIKISKEVTSNTNQIYPIKGTRVEELINTILHNSDLIEETEIEDSSYLYHLDKVAKTFMEFLGETFFSIEKKEKDLYVHLVTTNLEKRLKELIEKNKVFVMMSGTIHSETVLKTVFGLDKFKVVEAEIENQGKLVKVKTGQEIDCKYSNFQNQFVTREQYLRALSKSVDAAVPPTLVHVTGFSDLPTDSEKYQYGLNNLPTQFELINMQDKDPLGNRVREFKDKKTNILFTTKCNRGIDFPGEVCNSIIITKFPYPNISSIFWRILKQTRPQNYNAFYMDKSRRELLQKIYRGLRSKDDKVNLLSPDIRVLNFDFESKR